MRPAFPTSDYYGGSAPPGRYQWTTHLPTPDLAGQGSGRRSGGSHVRCGIDRRARCPAMPLRPRPAYAADFRRGLPAGHINRPRSHPTPTGAPGVHRDPAHIRQVGAGGILERRSTPVPHVHRPVLLAGPRPSGSAGPSRRCRGCLPPSPASPGSGCPQLQPPCCDKAAAKVSHLHSIPQRLVALDVPVPAWPTADLVVVQADLAFGALEALLDGLITNGKFCCVRRMRLSLTWWHRPLRLRRSGLQTDAALAGEPHDPDLDRLPPAQPASRRRAPLGPGLPAAGALGRAK
jgi:hypothetical protein